jgi:hypothetical protein
MNNFKLISEILIKEANESIDDIKHNPKLLAIKKKAEIIRTNAELLRAKNQIKTATLDNIKIKQKEEDHKAEVKTVNVKRAHKQDNEINLSSGNPINEPKHRSVEEDILEPADTKNTVNEDDEINLSSGNPVNEPKQKSVKEDILEPTDTKNTINEDDKSVQTPDQNIEQQNNTDIDNRQNQQPEDETVAEVAGEKAQSKEEAEIARLQAQTREIQSRIGEYKSAGGDDLNSQTQVDPVTGQPTDTVSNQSIDPMTGQPIVSAPPKEDPLKGFGDTTDPQAAQMAMMGGMPGQLDPMTGLPAETGPSKTPTTIGRLYVLKKIYYKLALLDKILTNSPDTELQEVAKITSEAFSIYRTIIQNLKTYKDQIDEVITDYYMLVKDIAAHVEKHFIMKTR